LKSSFKLFSLLSTFFAVVDSANQMPSMGLVSCACNAPMPKAVVSIKDNVFVFISANVFFVNDYVNYAAKGTKIFLSHQIFPEKNRF